MIVFWRFDKGQSYFTTRSTDISFVHRWARSICILPNGLPLYVGVFVSNACNQLQIACYKSIGYVLTLFAVW